MQNIYIYTFLLKKNRILEIQSVGPKKIAAIITSSANFPQTLGLS